MNGANFIAKYRGGSLVCLKLQKNADDGFFFDQRKWIRRNKKVFSDKRNTKKTEKSALINGSYSFTCCAVR